MHHLPLASGHTWKDIGGISGLLLDLVSLAVLITISGLVLLIGATLVVSDYLCHPIVLLLSWWNKEPVPEPRADQRNDYRLFLP